MKKFLRMVSVFALAGATLAYTGCTDYSEDIDKVNDRIDALSGTDLKSIGDQITALKTSISSLEAAKTTTNDAIKALQSTVSDLEKENATLTADNKNLSTNVSNLQTKLTSLENDAKTNAVEIASIKADITAIKKSIEANEESIAENKKNISANKTLIDGLTSKVAKVEASIASLNEQIKTLATKTYVDGEIAKLREELDSKLDAADTTKLNTTAQKYADAIKAYANETFATKDSLKKANDAIAALKAWVESAEGKYASGEGLLDALEKIEAAKTAADNAQKDATEALGKIDTINDALKGYATTTALEEKSKILQTNIDAAVKDLKAAIAKVDSTNADTAAVNALKKEIATLKKDLTAINSSLSGIGSDVDAKVDTGKFNKQIDAINNSIIKLDGALKDSIAKVTDKIAKAGDKITAAENEIAALKNGADTLDKAVNKFIGLACQNGGSISNAISAQISDSLKTIRDEIKGKVSSLDSRVSVLENSLNKSIVIAYGGVDYQQLRGLTFIPDAVTEDGVEVVRYTRVEYKAITLKDSTKSYSSSNINADKNAGFCYETATAKSSYFPTDTLSYKMNPSSAKVTKENKLSIEVRPVDIVRAVDKQPRFNGSAEFVSADNGILKVGLTLNNAGDSIDYNAKAQLFALSVAVKSGDKDTTVTSAYKMLKFSVVDAFALYSKDGATEKALATTFANALKESALEYVINYKDGGNIKDSLVTKFGNTTASTVYDFTANKWNLEYEFALVNYTNNGISQSDLVTIDADGKVTPKANSVLRIDAKPIVRVTLKDKTNNKIVAIGFLRLKLAPTTYFVRDIVEIARTIKNCDAAADTIKVDDTFRTAAGITGKKNNKEFNDAFALHTVSEKVVIYDSTEAGFAQATAYGELKVKEAHNGTVNRDSLIVSYDAKTLAKIYAEKNHSKKFYVRYVAKANANKSVAEINAKEGLYVPIKVTVSRTGKGTLSGKIESLWDGDKATLNADVPKYVAGDTSYTPLAATWQNNLFALWSADGNDEKIKVTIDGTDDIVGVGAKVWNYFAPVQPKVGDYYLKVKNTTFTNWIGTTSSPITDNAVLATYGDSSLVAWNLSGILGNQEVYATKDANKTAFAEDSLVAKIGDSSRGTISFSGTSVAKEILNSGEDFYVNIALNYGHLAGSSCFADQLDESALNKYYFLRPINMTSNGSKTFSDGKDVDAVESNVNILDILNFSDWRGTAFADAAKGDYSHVGYFNYYGIKSVNVLISEAKTNIRGEKDDNLGTLPAQIELSYMVNGAKKTEAQAISYSAGDGVSNVANSKNSYDNLVKNFGLINYHNNGYIVTKDYKIIVPVEITYTFGTLKTNVEITVKATAI